jgi:hypothetical protein
MTKKIDLKFILATIFAVVIFFSLFLDSGTNTIEAFDVSMMSYGIFFGVGLLIFSYKIAFFSIKNGLRFIFGNEKKQKEAVEYSRKRIVNDLSIISDYLYSFSIAGFIALLAGNVTAKNNPVTALGYGIIAFIFYFLKKNISKKKLSKE